MLFSRWRSHSRLRHTFLEVAFGDRPQLRDGLAEAYTNFNGATGRKHNRRGSFDEYLEELMRFVESDENSDETFTIDVALRAARRWRRTLLARTIAYQLALISLALAVVLVLVVLTVLVLRVLRLVSETTSIAEFLEDAVEPTWTNAWSIVTALVLALGLRSFLSRSLGDVVFWATRETEERHKVHQRMIKVGTRTLRQVIEDEKCQRVVIVAHSLGTPVAYESLLELGRINKSKRRQDPGGGPLQIDKLDQFVTLGSPIDKLHFFFESHTGGGYAYSRLFEELHGDVGGVPFHRNRKPQIHWVNVWDKADIISGPINSSNPQRSSRGLKPVDNVQVSTTWLPDPGLSHSAYFLDETVVGLMFNIIFGRRHTYANPPRMGPDHPYPDRPDYDSQDLGDVSSSVLTRPLQIIALALPWMIGATWLLSLNGVSTPVSDWFQRLTLTTTLVIALVVILGRIAGLRRPLLIPKTGPSTESPEGEPE